MTYEAWRISYQSSEQAARAAWKGLTELRNKIAAEVRNEIEKEALHLKLTSKEQDVEFAPPAQLIKLSKLK